jgi:hypothetical protein
MRAHNAGSLLLLVGLSACATLLGGGSSQPVSVSSTPTAAAFVVKSSSGLQMASGTTPSTIRLPRKNEYQVDITMPGYAKQTLALTKGVNGWVWANLILGGLVGGAIDFATGAAWKLDPAQIQVSLVRGTDDGTGVDCEVQILGEKGQPLSKRIIRLKVATPGALLPSPLAW